MIVWYCAFLDLRLYAIMCVGGGLQVCFGRVVVCFYCVACVFDRGCQVGCFGWWWVHGVGFMSVVFCFCRFV